MIIDHLDNLGRYDALHPLFAVARAFLGQLDGNPPKPGKVTLDATAGLFAIVTDESGLEETSPLLEAHREHIDIQYVLGGEHDMGWRHLNDCNSIRSAYAADRDVAFYNDEPTLWTRLPAGHLAILFPEDAHAPTAVDGAIHKVVVKVPVTA